ncbi:Arm DNA-binding domain-containing protein [Stenotrophomonas tumulicola]|uniref:DUF4102 domain-containing protein n=1 Tax=Stenotrophomonas tumulicola TaxID=1685415 RepID=A0A7W3IHN9_9GAMM|nr:Arm DNA-binding domain-containing protein [Stenotrophomonas tumulicola]MBA8681411.1 DUF4102 domain-containing protein [Stenotrophomonas tumulicola]
MLTDTKLRHLKPKAVVYRVAGTNGLCIEVRPTGAMVWRYRYRHDGKARMAALGEIRIRYLPTTMVRLVLLGLYMSSRAIVLGDDNIVYIDRL